MDVIETVTNVEGQALDGIKQTQDTVLNVARTVADRVGQYVPELPVSYPGQLPEPSVLVDNAFDFAGKVLATNRSFAKQLFEVLAPLAVVKPEAKSGPKAAPKAKSTAAA